LWIFRLSGFRIYVDYGCVAPRTHTTQGTFSSCYSDFRGRRTGRVLRKGPTYSRCRVPGTYEGRHTSETSQLSQVYSLVDLFDWVLSLCKRRDVVSEVLFNLRPVVHSWLLSRTADSNRWKPWMFALVVDVIGAKVLQSFIDKDSSTDLTTNALEIAEYNRRRSLIRLALLRSPFFDIFLQKPCLVLDNLIKKVPILNLFNVLESFLTFRNYYFATSGS